MALIKCPQCGKQVSDKARKCPHCGLDMTVPYTPPKAEIQEETPKKSRKVWPIIGAIAGVVIMVAIALWFFVLKGKVKTNEVEVLQQPVADEQPTSLEAIQQQLVFVDNSDTKPTSTVDYEIRQQLDLWASYHNDKDLTRLAALYDNQVEYYQANYSNSQVYDSKKKALDKNPQFRMEISNVTIDEYASYCEVSFDKKVWYNSSSTPKTYPSYLRYKKVNGSWKIIKENDRTSNSKTQENRSTSSYTSARYVVIDGTELRLRLGPSTSADTFKWADGSNRHPNKGERYRYLGESGDFYKIDFKGHELWVSKQYTYLE